MSTNLDNDPTAILRSHEHTNALQETFLDDARSLWDGYGVIGDIKVSSRELSRFQTS